MTPQEAPAFLERLNALGELFDAKFSEVKQQLYYEALKDLDLVELIVALNEAAKTCRFMPKPVEIRELAKGSVEDNAAAAWVEWKDEARRVGAYCNVELWAPIAHSLIDVFGSWPAACCAEYSPEMWASKRKEFIQAYKRHADDSSGFWCLTGSFALEEGHARISRVKDAVPELPAAVE